MIKQLKKSNISLSPFIATKKWELNNIVTDSLLFPITEDGITTEIQISVDYIDYTFGNSPIWSSMCNIGAEQNESNKVIFEEGVSSSFDPEGPKNWNGTYKSLIYNQIYNLFYNSYNNPTQIFGMENIDFPLSKINRYLADNFRMFSIPKSIFGDKIVKGSVQFVDTNLDDNVFIYDDGAGNLIASKNLFSKIQEVRPLGNMIIEGDEVVEYECPPATNLPPIGKITLEATQL